MSGKTQFLGVVQSGKFHQLAPAPDPKAPRRFTTIDPPQAVSQESGERLAPQYEGSAVLTEGVDQGAWVYSVTVLEQAGPIVTMLVREAFDHPRKRGSH